MDHLRRKGLWSSNCVNTISIRSVAIDRIAEVELGVEEVDGHLEVRLSLQLYWKMFLETADQQV